jgi:hypothetical protein
VAYTWNALGQLTRDGTYTYTWDAAGRLITVTDGITTLGFLYDGDGNPVRAGRTAAWRGSSMAPLQLIP